MENPHLHLHTWGNDKTSLGIQLKSNLDVGWIELGVPCGYHGQFGTLKVDF